jgi:hypothetical protein
MTEARMLDAAPLQRLIREKARARRVSLRMLAGDVAERLGQRRSYCERRITALLSADRVTLGTADRWCTALGSHVAIEWGAEVYNGATLTRREAV